MIFSGCSLFISFSWLTRSKDWVTKKVHRIICIRPSLYLLHVLLLLSSLSLFLSTPFLLSTPVFSRKNVFARPSKVQKHNKTYLKGKNICFDPVIFFIPAYLISAGSSYWRHYNDLVDLYNTGGKTGF